MHGLVLVMDWKKVGVWVGAVLTALLILLFSFKFVVVHGGYQSSLISSSLREVHEGVMSFLLGSSFVLPSGFGSREVSHLGDVRSFFSSIFFFLYVVLVVWFLVLFSLSDKQLVKKSLRFGSVVSLGVVFLVFLASLVSFSSLWSVLHAPFFSGGSWVFPSDSLLMMLYPESFFSAMAFRWGMIVFFSSIVVGILQFYLNGSGGGGGGH